MTEVDDTQAAEDFESLLLSQFYRRHAERFLREGTQELIGAPRIIDIREGADGTTVECSMTLTGVLPRIRIEVCLGEDMSTQFAPWSPEAPESDLDSFAVIQEVDPRVNTTHQVGVLPVPANPPPPEGWKYWGSRKPIPEEASHLCVTMLHAPRLYPMGSFARINVKGEVIGARVEWHNVQGATGKTGCFRGVNLMYKVPAAVDLEKELVPKPAW